ERISREGVIPLSPTFDHIGIFANDVATTKKVASVLVENWRLENWDRKPILGVPEEKYLQNTSEEGLKHFEEVCKLLSTNYQIIRVQVMDDFDEIKSRHDAIMSYDASQVHKEWFAKHEALYSQKFSDLVKRGRAVTNYKSQIEARDKFRNQITKVMDENQIDLWICPPAVGPAPKGLDSTGDPVMCLPWTQIGFPAINIPTTKNEEILPIGLQLVGKWNTDESLLAWAEEIEKVVRKI
ncbi:MAG TPA: amidase family protein, partial [Anaerolineales bacterium]|nr:amidase family protein [Anaerolineales bacterium]